MLWISFSFDICKSDTLALDGLRCYNYGIRAKTHSCRKLKQKKKKQKTKPVS
ncbi:hypothetical protein HanXRQr2_Chr01g0024051 [Helianthus annuus]|uniref:Uncharacterized protein n=1 Tax=Helianthus annuus TaxID=4232 RepID=A0A9K3P327_HELAN|nr:hypothetical protein HanXRQr2_Chr01g0024051 [Helianthus annuus]